MNGYDFDYDDFKKKARSQHFHGDVLLKFKDGEVVLVRVEQTFQIKDFDRIIEYSRNLM